MAWNPEAIPERFELFGGKVIGLTPKLRGDARGQLAELMRASEAGHDIAQVYAVWVKAGESRANHYHLHKHEWCSVVSGICRVDLRDMATGHDTEIEVGADAYSNCMILGIAPGVWHSFRATARRETDPPAIIIACASREFDPGEPDTFTADQWGKEGRTNV